MTTPYEAHLSAIGAAELKINALQSHVQVAHGFSQETMDMVIAAVGSEPRNADAAAVLATIAEIEEMLARQVRECETAVLHLNNYTNGAF